MVTTSLSPLPSPLLLHPLPMLSSHTASQNGWSWGCWSARLAEGRTSLTRRARRRYGCTFVAQSAPFTAPAALRVVWNTDEGHGGLPLAAIAMRTTTRSNVLSLSRSRCWVRHHRCRRPRSHRRSGHRRRRLHRLCHCRRCRSRWRHACRLPHSDPHARPNSDPHARRPRWVGFRIRAVYRVSCPYSRCSLTSYSSRKWCCPLQASPLRPLRARPLRRLQASPWGRYSRASSRSTSIAS